MKKKVPSNEFVITGRLTSLRSRKNGDRQGVVISRNGNNDLFVHMIFPKDVLKENLKNRIHVRIRGHIRAQIYTDEAKKLKYSQSFIADEIETDETLADKYFGIHGKFYPIPSCEICLKGKISNVLDNNDWMRYQIEIPEEDGKKSSLRLSMKKIDRHPDINKGDEVCVIGSLTTPKKEINGKNRTFEDILVMDIVKIDSKK